MPTVEECLDYMGIDYADDMIRRNVARALATGIKIMEGAVGDDVADLMPDDPRVKELVLIYADDLYTQKGLSAKVSGATRRLVADMEMQVRLDLRTIRERGSA